MRIWYAPNKKRTRAGGKRIKRRRFEPLTKGDLGKSAAARKMVEGGKTIKARKAAKGFQGPDLKECVVDTSGNVSLLSLDLQVIPLSAKKKNVEITQSGNYKRLSPSRRRQS